MSSNNTIVPIIPFKDKVTRLVLFSFIFLLIFGIILFLIYSLTNDFQFKENHRKLSSTEFNIHDMISSDENTSLSKCKIIGCSNACSGNMLKDDWVSLESLTQVMNKNIKLLHFEIYSIKGDACVASSESASFSKKGSYNHIPIGSLCDHIRSHHKGKLPLFLLFKIKTKHTHAYNEIASKIQQYFGDKLYIPLKDDGTPDYDHKSNDFSKKTIKELYNKIIIMVHTEDEIIYSTDLSKYTNIHFKSQPSLSIFNNTHVMYQSKQLEEKDSFELAALKKYNKTILTCIVPYKTTYNPTNAIKAGCQFIAFNFGMLTNYKDKDNLKEIFNQFQGDNETLRNISVYKTS